MTTKTITGLAATAVLAGWMGAAQAGTVSLDPDNSTIAVGQTVTFSYNMDFTDDNTIGGGTDFYYDSTILQFVGWQFDAGLTTDDSGLRRDPTDCLAANTDAGCGDSDFAGLAQLNGLGWGNFSGMSGPETIGQLVFQAIGEGAATIFMTANDDGDPGNPGPFFSSETNMMQNVNFVPGQVQVMNPVPVPAAAWLMLSGIGMLGGLRRFRA